MVDWVMLYYTCSNVFVHASIGIFCSLFRREGSKQNWERIKTSIGTRWSWLEHRIAAINKELCRLDHEIQRRPSQEQFTFAAPPNPSHPSYFALPNGSFLDHLHKGGNGSLVSTAASGLYKGAMASRPSNGFGHNVGGGTQSHCLPHFLLPENLLGSKLQVGIHWCYCYCFKTLDFEGNFLCVCYHVLFLSLSFALFLSVCLSLTHSLSQ